MYISGPLTTPTIGKEQISATIKLFMTSGSYKPLKSTELHEFCAILPCRNRPHVA